ncbi:FprA family A-type flavoprotein [Candidatus Hydrogenedentota bacterium]
MSETFKATRVTDNVYWVGAIDWNVRDFHGYETDRGSTYNAYLVMADKITLIDTVKAPFKGEMLARIASVVDPAQINYIISNHSEMDHTGCLPEVIETMKPERVFASAMGVKALSNHFSDLQIVEAVKDGQSLDLGDMKLIFTETRMLHWPDSMFSYLEDERLLFSQDVFGMHLATGERFADEIEDCLLENEAAKYYANIVMPYSSIVEKTLAKVAESGMQLDIIAPDHGPIWRTPETIEGVIARYARWAAQRPTMKALVVYDTMWHSTEKMATAIAEGLSAVGAVPQLMSLSANHRTEIATEVLEAGALLVGSPTLNNNILPTVADILTYLKGLRPKNLIGVTFGSYGWSGESVKIIEGFLNNMKVELIEESLGINYVPDDKVLEECFALGNRIGKKLKSVCS